MCGRKIGTRRYMVDGTVMSLGACCAKYGTPLDQPAPQGSQASVQQGLERRATRSVRRDVYSEQGEEVLVEDFGRRVREARERKGWSHPQLGDKVSARVPQLHKIEANQLRPSDDLARRIEKELGITLFEKVERPAAVSGATGKQPAQGLTLGDLIKDAMKKKKQG